MTLESRDETEAEVGEISLQEDVAGMTERLRMAGERDSAAST